MEYIPLHVNPFLKYQPLKVQTERDFLTPEEIAAIEALNLEDKQGLARARDFVLFQYYSGGIRVSDVLLLKPENIHNGRVYLTIKKTGVQVSHKLTPKAIEIARHYLQYGNEFIFGYLPDGLDLNNPEKVNAKINAGTTLINRCLKDIGNLCKLKKALHSHIFRHAFSMNSLQQGMPLEALQGILHHSNIKETQIYGKIQNKALDAAMDKLNL
jgi:site-specific recombinase XerD